MILVNSPGNRTPYQWLEHSVWNGCTLADLVFPFFIVIVGISSVLALSNLQAKPIPRAQLFNAIIKRTLFIFFMGLLLNVLPNHFDLDTVRILGVLQRIAICYFFSALLFLTTRIQTQAIIALVLLIGYAALQYCGFDVSYFDRLVFSPGHLYTPNFDPEGLLSTLPALASVLIGNLIGYLLTISRTKKQTLQQMFIIGIMLACCGWALSFILLFNKSIWSSSYVLWTSGLAILLFALIYALIEIKQWVRWSIPFDLFGHHAMLIYVLHVLGLKIQAMIHIRNTEGVLVSFKPYITNVLFGTFTPQNAALLYSVSYILFWFFVLKCLNKNAIVPTRKPYKREK